MGAEVRRVKMGPRPKKYQLIVNLADLNLKINILDLIKEDFLSGTRRLASSEYTVTTSGGDNSFWQVNEKKEILFTISTGSLGQVRVNPYVTVNRYRHYVLTEEGVRFVKNLVVEHAI